MLAALAEHCRKRSARGPRAASSSGSSCPASPTAAPCSRARRASRRSRARRSARCRAPAALVRRRDARRDRGRGRAACAALWRSSQRASIAAARTRVYSPVVATPARQPSRHVKHRAHRITVVIGVLVAALALTLGSSQAAVSSTIHAYFDADGHLMFTYNDGTQVSGTIPPGTYQVIYDNLGADDLAVDHAFHLSGPGLNFAAGRRGGADHAQRHLRREPDLHAAGRPASDSRAAHVRGATSGGGPTTRRRRPSRPRSRRRRRSRTTSSGPTSSKT